MKVLNASQLQLSKVVVHAWSNGSAQGSLTEGCLAPWLRSTCRATTHSDCVLPEIQCEAEFFRGLKPQNRSNKQISHGPACHRVWCEGVAAVRANLL